MRTLVMLAGAAVVSACSIGSPVHLIYNGDDDDDSVSTTTASLSCDSPFVTPDLSTLTVCGATAGGTGGHCYDADKVPTMGTLPTAGCASAQVCVPDAVLSAGGTTPLKTCTSVIGKPGACASLFIAEIAKEKAQLTQDACTSDERCVPCVNPLNGTDTPFCQPIGVHQDACGAAEAGASTPAATTPQLCCPTEGPPQGVCLQGDNIPASQRGNVEQNVCPPDYSCVPSSLVNNDPVSCSSAEGSGVCVDSCFTGDLGERALLQGSCPGPRDKCVPCLIGKGEGLPGCD